MRAPRGQNLVLLALTMLFLALMVTITIGLGLRIRQKQELQNIADASAYSNAVMTARAFNNMAIINRLEVSYFVALAADESLISWTAYASAMAAGARNAANQAADNGRCTPRAARQLRDFAGDVSGFIGSDVHPSGLWRTADRAAGMEALAIQGRIAGLRTELSMGGDSVQQRLNQAIGNQLLTSRIITASKQNADVSVINTGAGASPNTAGKVSRREIDCDFGGSGNEDEPPAGSGLCMRATWNENMLMAAMGTRGSSFLTGRSQMPPKVLLKLTQLDGDYGAVTVSYGGKNGSAYWSDGMHHGNNPNGTEAWGDDHGSVTVSGGDGCSATIPITAHVRSTHLINRGDQHQWSPPVGPADPDPDEDHTMGDCTPRCPSVWVRTIGFQPGGAADAWGQPKVMAAVQRDLTVRTFPWELNFKFPFSATGPASEWDGRGRRLHTRAGRNLNISTQTAFATGMAYYHRRNHWNEFPNLLNPFWRATLVPVDVDNSPRDVNRALSAPEFKWQRDAYDALRASGFEGLH